MTIEVMLSAAMGFAFGTLAMRTICKTWHGALVCGTVVAITALTVFDPIVRWIIYGLDI